jgi:hypothetical protein
LPDARPNYSLVSEIHSQAAVFLEASKLTAHWSHLFHLIRVTLGLRFALELRDLSFLKVAIISTMMLQVRINFPLEVTDEPSFPNFV